MSEVRKTYILGVLKGLQRVLTEVIKLQEADCKKKCCSSVPGHIVRNTVTEISKQMSSAQKGNLRLDNLNVEKSIAEILQRSSMILEGIRQVAVAKHYQADKPSDIQSYYDLDVPLEFSMENTDAESERTNEMVPKCDSTGDGASCKITELGGKRETHTSSLDYANVPPKARKPPKRVPKLSENAKASTVPASRLARVVSFGTLAAGLGLGTVAEVTRRTLGLTGNTSLGQALDNAFVTPANAERIVNTLCKVRGAALKIGQILSIQDNKIISPELQRLFERVRQSADFMPAWQVEKVLSAELGLDWRSKMSSFEMKPFAAASIGQVHQATLLDGREVAVKIQYPGVAKGIESDIDNLVSVLKLWNVFPEGMFIDNLVEVAKEELAWEVDYVREAECTKKFKSLLQPYKEYHVPEVIDDLCTRKIFTTELIEGMPVDKCADLDLQSREYICQCIMRLVLKELFEFQYMQTDPNWSNFFYNAETRQIILLDFGASRSYSDEFIDDYIGVIKCAVDGDRNGVLEGSKKMGFLTGYESQVMEDAHVDAVMILGEVFCEEGFDFGAQDTTLRLQSLVPTIINHRLCPPPQEIYSLHRKLSGAFLLFSKLNVKMNSKPLFLEIYEKYLERRRRSNLSLAE